MPRRSSEPNLITIGDVAQRLDCSVQYVLKLERLGRLPIAARVGSCRIRLFDRATVERLAIERAAKKGAAA